MAEPKLLFCGVRDGVDTWQLECRFDDGQKFAAVEVDIEHEELATQIAAYLNRSAAERVELGLAEVRIKQLQEQLTACEAALAERDARVLSLSRLVWGVVHNAGRMLTSGRVPRWVAVRDALAVGSTTANQLCREHKLDPDEQVGRGDQCGGCAEDGGTCGGCICSEEESQYCTRSDEDLGGKCCDCERSEEKEADREKILAELKKQGQNLPTGQLALGSRDCPTSPTGVCVYDADEDPCYDDCLFCHNEERK
jgi:hypothetical protein